MMKSNNSSEKISIPIMKNLMTHFDHEILYLFYFDKI